jgi:hypothetical protein
MAPIFGNSFFSILSLTFVLHKVLYAKKAQMTIHQIIIEDSMQSKYPRNNIIASLSSGFLRASKASIMMPTRKIVIVPANTPINFPRNVNAGIVVDYDLASSLH